MCVLGLHESRQRDFDPSDKDFKVLAFFSQTAFSVGLRETLQREILQTSTLSPLDIPRLLKAQISSSQDQDADQTAKVDEIMCQRLLA